MSFLKNTERALRIVAADDSSVMRHMLSTLFASIAEYAAADDLRVELIAVVPDGVACLDAVRNLRPDMVLLDLEMPRLNGMEVLDILHREMPRMPVIMCSASTARGAATTIEALARGAADYVTKPSGSQSVMAAMASLSAQLLPKIRAFGEKFLLQPKRAQTVLHAGGRAGGGGAEVVGIGVSTGGPAALEQLLPAFARDFAAPILIVQHMPKLFTRALAERLDKICKLSVREAEEGDVVTAGTIWLSPGDRHMQLVLRNGALRIALNDEAPEQHCRPAVDHLFRSMAQQCAATALGVVLTGMGSDGLAGARAMVEAGGEVVVQDQATSAVWGMPGRVAEAGLASALVRLDAMHREICNRVQPKRAMAQGGFGKECEAHAL